MFLEMGCGIVISFAQTNWKKTAQLILCLAIGLLAGCRSTSTKTTEADPAESQQAAGEQAPSSSPARTPIAGVKSAVRFEQSTTGLPDTGMWKCDPVFGDVNKDGHLDLALYPRKGDGAHVWFGDSKGNWKESPSIAKVGNTSCGGGLELVDINKDGNLDLAIGDHCNGGYVFLGDGKGGWTEVASKISPRELAKDETEYDAYAGAEDIDIADFNGDGHADMILGATDKGGISVFLGDSTGTTWTYQKNNLPKSRVCSRVAFVDINDDNKVDIIAAYVDGPRVWLGDGTGGWKDGWNGLPTPFLGGLYRGQEVADFNKDGRKDLLVANWVDGPELYLQNADGSWTKSGDVFPQMSGGAVGLDVGDVDKDGNLDIVLTGRMNRKEVGYVNGIFFLKGDGTGKFQLVENSGLPAHGLSFSWGVKLEDVNKDGYLDFAVGSGGIVATDPKRTEPILAPRVLFYLGKPDASVKP